MGIWEKETLLLRLIAVLFVFALLRICRGKKETGRETVLYLIVVTASATVNLLRSGGGGFLLSIIGAIAAFSVSAPLLARDRIVQRDLAAAVAAGSLLGPLGGTAAIGLAAAIYLMQRATGLQPALRDRLIPSLAGPAAAADASHLSILAILERRGSRKTAADHFSIPAGASAGIAALPWRASLAVATLAVLMTGMFV